MTPYFKDKDMVIVLSYLFFNPKIGDVIVFEHSKKVMVKRIKTIKGKKYYVLGDNFSESTDSRHFGYIERNVIIGKVVFKL